MGIELRGEVGVVGFGLQGEVSLVADLPQSLHHRREIHLQGHGAGVVIVHAIYIMDMQAAQPVTQNPDGIDGVMSGKQAVSNVQASRKDRLYGIL